MQISKKQLVTAAGRCGQWLVKNQIVDPNSADCGRYVAEYIESEKRIRLYSPNWPVGNAVLSLLMLHKRTGSRTYLDSARKAVEYLKSLQVMDTADTKNYGMIREVTPQTDYCHPRDAATAAWALLHLGTATGDRAYVDRAVLFAEWFNKNAIKKGYPAWTCRFNGKHDWLRGSFHGGSPLFFFDLAELTGDKNWLQPGLKILDTYLKTFVNTDGAIKIIVSADGKKDLTDNKKYGPPLWQHMHKYNDDFTLLSLQRAYKITGKKRYLESALKYADWVLGEENTDGSFGRPPVYSAAATLALELLDLHELTGEGKYRDAAVRSAAYLLGLQETKTKDVRAFGAFYGLAGARHRPGYMVSVRISNYAIAALLKLEGKYRYGQYTA